MSEQQKFSRTTRIDILPDFAGSPTQEGRAAPSRMKRLRVKKGPAAKEVGGRDFQALLQSSYDAALIADMNGIIVDANVRAVEFLGFSRAVLIGQSVGGLVSGWDISLLGTIRSTLENDRFVLLQAYCTRRDSTVFPAEIAVMKLSISSGDHLCFFIRDITLRKETENRLRVGANAIDNAGEGIAIVDLSGVLKFSNGAADEIWGLPEDATLLGLSLTDLLIDEDAIRGLVEAAEARMRWSAEVQATRANGDVFDVQLSAAPNVNADDELIGIVLSISDITERKETDRKLHDTLEELARSNSDLEQFAYVVSHDLQEPLRKITQFGEMLKKRTGDALSEEATGYVSRMQAAAKRMGDLIRGILALSRVSTRARGFERVDLVETATGVVSDLEARIHETEGRVDIGDLPAIDADQTQMRQLMQNLIANGLKFHKPDAPPFVKVYGRATIPDDTDTAQEEAVDIVVEDNGIGFDESHAERIFGIFQRLHTRSEYEGTGIGLAVCRKIAERHGGHIRALSTPGTGTQFIVTLPLTQMSEA